MTELRKVLNTRGLTLIAIGACIGSGIFVTPASTMQYIPHHGYALLTWLVGGLVAYLGAMTFSELGSTFPKEGGVYVYLKNAYGNLAGFLYGWIILLIVNTGALAALGYALADFLNFFFIVSKGAKSMIAIGVIWFLTLVNIFGVNISQYFASLFTGLKLLAILFIIVVGLYFLPAASHDLHFDLTSQIPSNLWSGILLAFVGVFWSMGGWHHATYLSGETLEPERTVPKSMLYGTFVVTAVYLLVILSYMSLLPIAEMAGSKRIAGDALASVFTFGGQFVTLIICISIFGTIGIYTMSAPRIYYAMAKDRVFFSFLSHVSTKYGTPYKAMLFQAAWATILILAWGSFYKMITFVTFMDIVFMVLATSTIFVFRKRQVPNAGYRLRYFPLIPLLYLLVTVAFVVNTLAQLNAESWVGVLILVLGIPVYYYFKGKQEINA